MLKPLLADWSLFLLAILLASNAMLRIASRMPWSPQAVQSRMPLYFGMALAPFLFGFLGVLLLGLLPGASHGTHLAVFFGTLVLLNAVLWKPCLRMPCAPRHRDRWETLAMLLLGLVVLCLFFNTIAFPLTQNDPLEYATVARAFYESRSLSIYPLVGPSADGFYGPWTHPPLYVAAIYNGYLLQGHADMPGLARFLTPWFALAAGGLVYALGSFISRRAGLYALVLFASPPLFFLGIESSSIDVLPVIGFLMVVVAVIGLRGLTLPVAAWAGMVLGIALWTHSQGMLFVPLAAVVLVLVYGLSAWRKLLPYYVVMVLVAGAVALWPYLNNLQVFGAIISDNPDVFALPVLDWPSYFRFNRGVDSWPSILQYGVLKGWFAYDAYGFIFWLLGLALVVYAIHVLRRRQCFAGIWRGPETAAELLPWVSAGVIATYLVGVVVSVTLGIDLMIRNERYMLVILPFVALLGGWYIDRLLVPGTWRWLRLLIVLGTLCALIVQLFVFVVLRMEINRMNLGALNQPHAEKLLHRPEYRTIDYLRQHTPKDAVVLALKPADMYYAHRRMVSYLDPVMLDFYRSADARAGLAQLKSLGITHVQVPEYSLPPFYNSVLQDILADPALSRLEFSAAGHQIYALAPAAKQRPARQQSLLNDGAWSYEEQLVIPGRKALKRVRMSHGPFDIRQISVAHWPMGFFQRDASRTVLTGTEGELSSYIKVPPGACYTVRFTLSGKGYVELWALHYDESGAPNYRYAYKAGPRQMIGGTVLDGTGRAQTLAKHFCIEPGTAYLRLALEHYGNSSLKLQGADLLTFRE